MLLRRQKGKWSCTCSCCYQKGKGYEYAEKDPKTFHGINKFNIETGESPQSKESFSSVFGEYMCDIAQNDRRICGITAAMGPGVGLDKFAELYKERFLMLVLQSNTQ